MGNSDELQQATCKSSTPNELALRKKMASVSGWNLFSGRKGHVYFNLYFLFHLNNGQPINHSSLERNLRTLQVEEWLYHK